MSSQTDLYGYLWFKEYHNEAALTWIEASLRVLFAASLMTMFSLESSNPMAVYTTLSSAQVSAYLSPFNLGELIELRGISGGIENTNYFVTTQVKGQPPPVSYTHLRAHET